MYLPFDAPESLAINRARLSHLASLGLCLNRRTVLEPGAGIGHLTGFWEDRDCEVTSLDLLAANVAQNQSRHPGRQRVICRGVEQGFADLGRFGIVFCYGLLYHVANPEKCLIDMAAVCDDLMLIETMVHPVDDGKLHRYSQREGRDQGKRGTVYRPARNWLIDRLRSLMGFGYISLTQPDYRDYCLRWPCRSSVCRAVFVGSRTQLWLPTLSENAPSEQQRIAA